KREVVVLLDLDVSTKGLEIQRGLVPVFFLHDGIVWPRRVPRRSFRSRNAEG
ncbi:5794_t:CDS:1, partial [Scutellospora calospora]